MKLNFMNTHRVGQNSLEPYRSSKISQKQSKSAGMDQTGYAIEQVTRMLSRIIDLKISNPYNIHFLVTLDIFGLFEEVKTSQKLEMS